MKFKLSGSMVAGALLLASLPVNAADMPRPVYKGGAVPIVPVFTWTGFYLGINAGYGFGTSNWQTPAISNSPKGFVIGGTAGYNYQMGSMVLGFEADLDWAMVSGDTACAPGGNCETKNYWLTTVRGRLGYAFGRWMPYISGGGAYGGMKATNTGLTPPGLTGATATNFGWTAGGGIEYAYLGGWTAKLEYLYVDLGTFNCMACAATTTNSISFKEHLVRVGLNYKFTGL